MKSRKGHQALRIGRCSIPSHFYFITFNTHLRRPVFNEFENSVLFSATLTKPCTLNTSKLLAWVLMPDHVHLIIQLGERQNLGRTVQKIKSLTAKTVNSSGRVWDTGFYDQMIRNPAHLLSIARYMVANPIRANLVTTVKDYPFWDAVWVT